MANFLLWNVNRKSLDALVLALVEEHSIDGLFRVEYPAPASRLGRLLAEYELNQVPSLPRFGVFFHESLRVRRPPPLRQSRRVDFWQVTESTGKGGLFALFHGSDRRNYDNATRSVELRNLADQVRYLEHQLGNTRSVVLGDFNANPFESAVAGSEGLHAIGVRRVRGRTTRRIHSAERTVDFFYNPMWRLFGHGPDAAAATHYYAGYGIWVLS